ncbi:hypothetical protein BD779DRAFT_1479055 [Infundibulicybe gibba]|nr:hypothetical protein BD779DRAFT_1479055 [Infundibulicybe gibba]
MPRQRRERTGLTGDRFEICAHTCKCGDASTSRRPGGLKNCPIFKTSGNSAKRHSLTGGQHPDCDGGCPAHNESEDQQLVREPTLEEWKRWAASLATQYPDLVNEVQAKLKLEKIGVGGSDSGAGDDLNVDFYEEEGPNEEGEAGMGGGDESAGGESPPGTGSSIISKIGLDPVEGGSGSIPRSRGGDREGELKTTPDFPIKLSLLDDLKVVFVPDPSRAANRSESVEGLLTWFELRLTKERYKEILEDFGQYITPSKNEGHYWIHESLLMVLGPDGEEPEFDLSVIPWRKFRECMIQGNWEQYSELKDANVVFCGVDLTIDFMGRSGYGFNRNNFDPFLSGIGELKKRCFVWPDAEDMLRNGNKYSLARNLHEIHPTTYPIFFTVTPGVRPEEWEDVGKLGVVLKRSFSETSNHVVIPQNFQGKWEDLAEKESDSAELYERIGLSAAWYGQRYNTWVEEYGEVRVFLAGGSIVEKLLTLSDLTKHHRQDSWVNNEYQMYRDGLEGITELDHFVMWTVERLLKIEERGNEGIERMSGLRVFCRMDISVFQQSGEWWYYVNEIDRTHNASLFARGDIGMARNVARQEIEWIQDERVSVVQGRFFCEGRDGGVDQGCGCRGSEAQEWV